MKKITFLLIVLTLAFNSVSSQTVFDFDTNAVDNGDDITQTIAGIMVTGINNNATAGINLVNYNGYLGTTANVVEIGSGDTGSSITFTFDQAVVVNSIIPIDGLGGLFGDSEYTFTPTGGDNPEVKVAIVGGAAATGTVDLNWIGVTSFTVTAPSGSLMAFDDLSVYPFNPTVFDFDTNAVDNGDDITQSIAGIMVTGINNNATAGINLVNYNGYLGTTANVVEIGSGDTGSSITFTFDQAVVVNSIIPIDGLGGLFGDSEYTFTPTGGDNPEVKVAIVGGAAATGTVDLNWIGVTSFTVTAPSGSLMAFDDLSVSSLVTLSVTDGYKYQEVSVYPNPVVNILYVKNVLNLKSINVYNNLGQLVLQTKQETIDVSHLSNGMYFLEINTNNGTETKRIIKK